jgi:hypothetical protein
LKHSIKRVIKNTLSISATVLTSTILCGLISTQAKAENFTLSGGMSLNTNNAFAPVDGSPRLSLYAQNNSDPDQIFERIEGRQGGTLLKNRTTGKCINVHYTYNYGKVNVWNCDANDIDQNFDLLDFGNSVVVLRRSGTNFCINSPQHYNAGQVFMWDCNGNDPDQRFVMSGGTISSNPPGTTPIPSQSNSPTIQNMQKGSCYSKTYFSWWGLYTFLDACAARDLAGTMAAGTNQNAYGPIPDNQYTNGIKAGLSGSININKGIAAWNLQFCADRVGQAYIKYPYLGFKQVAQVTCF